MGPFPVPEISDNSPHSYENWRCYRGGNPCSAAYEVNFYTDAGHISGEAQVGPYHFINTLLKPRSDGNTRPAIVLRWFSYWPLPLGYSTEQKTTADHYHGGDQYDEIAAVLSLLTGLRFAAGGIRREFNGYVGELGRPVYLNGKREPSFIPPLHQPQISRFQSPWNITDAEKIRKVYESDRKKATIIIKVARLYQQAAWIADFQPEMAWLLLISAVETAAGFWSKENPNIIFEQALDPVLDKAIKETGTEAMRQPLTEYWQETSKATSKFVEFLMTFLPIPPGGRPQFGIVDFSNTADMREGFKTLYHYRSRALHGGKAFPAPLCIPPSTAGEEKPFALGLYTSGARWWFEDTPMPMLLHMFEYITRGAILNWVATNT